MSEDPRGFSHADLADPANVRAHLVTQLEDAADWRLRKARDYPDDTRNTASNVALQVAAREVGELADDDPRLVLLASFHEGAANEQRAFAYFSEYTDADRLIGRHGFGSGATQTTGELLAALVNDALQASERSAASEGSAAPDA